MNIAEPKANKLQDEGFWKAVGRSRVPVFLVLMVGAFALFGNTFANQWTMDDFPVIVENPDVRSWALFWKDSYQSRPLREITFLLDYALFGLEPAGYHIQNIFWHGLNAGLLFLLMTRLGAKRLVAWAVALLFLTHPITVEVVANTSHRKDSLALAFLLLSMLGYLKSCELGRGRIAWLALSVLSWFVACLGKQNAVILPVAWFVYEAVLVPEQGQRLWKIRYYLAALCTLGALSFFGWLFLGGGHERLLAASSGMLGKMNYFSDPSLSLYFRMVLKSWAFMFSKLFWPFDLAMEYTYSIPETWVDPWVLAALLGVGAVVAALWASFRRMPLVFWGLIWLCCFWLPVANIWPLAYFAADRYLYAPSVGLFVAAGCLWGRAWGRQRAGLIVATLALVFCLGVLTWQQNLVWRSPESLWTQAYRVSPRSAFALNNMGNIYFQQGDLRQALDFYLRAVRENPHNPTTHFNLGLVSERLGQAQGALVHYRNFLRIENPTYSDQQQRIRDHLQSRFGISAERLP